MKTLFIVFVLIFTTSAAHSADSLCLVINGKANYEIGIKTDKANDAAQLLQAYIDTISGVKLNLSNGKTQKFPLIDFIEDPLSDIHFDGFVIRTKKKNIEIISNSTDGFCNAVFWLLEHCLGCRYYAYDALVIPKRESIIIASVNTIQNPVFEFRVNYNGSAFYKRFAQWHGLHNKPHDGNSPHFEISDNWGLWVHTLHQLVPPETFFKQHPEYYALRNGIRIPDQLCLSNPQVLAIVIDALKKEMEKKPTARFWSVSQMDNFNYCECDACHAIDQANGSPSGSMITFVNQIAKAFPDKVISTLAYQYTRKAPLLVKPLANVNIMLCSIESNRNVPINEDSTQGGFRYDLEQWGALTNNIIVWDYVINFSNIIGPFPNFHVLQPNLALFASNHVTMMFEQGWPHLNGEFTDLRCYVISKLLWDPTLNTDSLMLDFCLGYYGPGGKNIFDYIQLSTANLLQSGRALTLYEPMSAHAQGFLSPQNLDIYFSLFDRAIEQCGSNAVYRHRIQMAMQPLRYAWLEVAKSLPFTDNWIFEKDDNGNYTASKRAISTLNELCNMAVQYGPILFHEVRLNPQEYFDSMSAYFKYGVQMHKAVGKTISFSTPCSQKYSANGANSLIDGICGTENYFCLWQGWDGLDVEAIIDLGKIESINSIESHFLVNQQSWIFLPESFMVAVSSDGKKFVEMGGIELTNAREKRSSGIVPVKMGFAQSTSCRYVRVRIKNIGKIPQWRGIDGNAWLFVDEIIVR